MPGTLTTSPADVLRRLLIVLGHGADPPATPWPVFVGREPDTPDSVITIRNTSGRNLGKTMPDGERQELHGVSVRVRSASYAAGYTKARQIAVALDEDIDQEVVAAGSPSRNYRVHAVHRTGDVNDLGPEEQTRRSVFTLNALMSVREL